MKEGEVLHCGVYYRNVNTGTIYLCVENDPWDSSDVSLNIILSEDPRLIGKMVVGYPYIQDNPIWEFIVPLFTPTEPKT